MFISHCNRLLAVVALVVATLPSLSAADVLMLEGTIRDFNDSHPDFEGNVGNDRGNVEFSLPWDGRPPVLKQYITLPTQTITSRESFDQWYNDVPGVNQLMPFSIPLTLMPDGTYYYDNSNFFPIDNQLFGNQGRNHNYHFTFHIPARFTYTEGDQFSFRGDDDFYLYLNNELVIDLGGVHGPQDGSIDLDTLGLVPGETYRFDLFFAERHTAQSSFRIQTNINLTQTVQFPPTCEATGFFVDENQQTVEFVQMAYDYDGGIVSYHWDFGDGQTSTLPNPVHEYAEPGDYVVELCVTDDDGLVSCCEPTDLQVVATEKRNWDSLKSIYR